MSEIPAKLRAAATLLNALVRKSKQGNWGELVNRYENREPSNIGVFFLKEGFKVRFRIEKDGEFTWKFGYKALGNDVATEVYCDTLDTLFNIRDGKCKVLDQKSHQLLE